ncbi:MAG: hypothetical protein GY797_08870, partial [Deltaproteobacteria bacterium]|nr:hypothetical protein [Deltaproteobacteria bacterium]
MSLDYDKISRNKETPQTSMSSYSDLFAALAFIFLFLYVVSTLQLSLQAISSKIEVKKYEAKLHSYEIPSYTPNPKQINYDKIIAKLTFLENQTNEEVEKFYKQVQEFKKHEKELISNYQSVVSHVKRENDDMVVALKQQRRITKNQKTEFDTKIANKEREYVDNLRGLRNQLTQSEKNLKKLAEGKKTIVAEKTSLLSEREKLEKAFLRTRAKVQLLEKEREVVKAEKEKLLIARQNMKKEIAESKTRLHV